MEDHRGRGKQKNLLPSDRIAAGCLESAIRADPAILMQNSTMQKLSLSFLRPQQLVAVRKRLARDTLTVASANTKARTPVIFVQVTLSKRNKQLLTNQLLRLQIHLLNHLNLCLLHAKLQMSTSKSAYRPTRLSAAGLSQK